MVTVALESVSVRLGRRLAIDRVSATLSPGCLVGVIGPNGAGKSTLVRAMLGLVPLAGGSVRLDGTPIASLARARIARTLAYLPQGQTLHWAYSVETLVALGRLPHGAPASAMAAADRAAIERAIRRTDLEEVRRRAVTELSGGERSRALLARALAVEAPGLVADEPLVSLDPGHQLDVMDVLKGEAGGGALVVVVLHDLTFAARYCDRLLLLDRGRLLADGRPSDVLTPDLLRRAYAIDARVELERERPIVVAVGRSRPAPPSSAMVDETSN